MIVNGANHEDLLSWWTTTTAKKETQKTGYKSYLQKAGTREGMRHSHRIGPTEGHKIKGSGTNRIHYNVTVK